MCVFRYLDHLLDYLYNYCSRVKPLMDIDKELVEKATKDFDIQWATGIFPGWKVSGFFCPTSSIEYISEIL